MSEQQQNSTDNLDEAASLADSRAVLAIAMSVCSALGVRNAEAVTVILEAVNDAYLVGINRGGAIALEVIDGARAIRH